MEYRIEHDSIVQDDGTKRHVFHIWPASGKLTTEEQKEAMYRALRMYIAESRDYNIIGWDDPVKSYLHDSAKDEKEPL